MEAFGSQAFPVWRCFPEPFLGLAVCSAFGCLEEGLGHDLYPGFLVTLWWVTRAGVCRGGSCVLVWILLEKEAAEGLRWVWGSGWESVLAVRRVFLDEQWITHQLSKNSVIHLLP